jgi:hypothetical protein
LFYSPSPSPDFYSPSLSLLARLLASPILLASTISSLSPAIIAHPLALRSDVGGDRQGSQHKRGLRGCRRSVSLLLLLSPTFLYPLSFSSLPLLSLLSPSFIPPLCLLCASPDTTCRSKYVLLPPTVPHQRLSMHSLDPKPPRKSKVEKVVPPTEKERTRSPQKERVKSPIRAAPGKDKKVFQRAKTFQQDAVRRAKTIQPNAPREKTSSPQPASLPPFERRISPLIVPSQSPSPQSKTRAPDTRPRGITPDARQPRHARLPSVGTPATGSSHTRLSMRMDAYICSLAHVVAFSLRVGGHARDALPSSPAKGDQARNSQKSIGADGSETA